MRISFFLLLPPPFSLTKEGVGTVLALAKVTECLPLAEFLGAATPVGLPHLVLRDDRRRSCRRVVEVLGLLDSTLVRLLRLRRKIAVREKNLQCTSV